MLHHHHQQVSTQQVSTSQQSQQQALNALNSLNSDQLSIMHKKLQNLQQQQNSSTKNDQLSLMLQACAKKKMEGVAMVHSFQQQQMNSNSFSSKPKCPECGKIYSNNSNLKQHIVNVHTVQTEYISCHVCNKQFKTKQYLQIHLLSMHGIRKRKSYMVYQMSSTQMPVHSIASPTPQQHPSQSFPDRWPEEKN